MGMGARGSFLLCLTCARLRASVTRPRSLSAGAMAGSMQSQMEDMVQTALAGDPNVLIQARMPGGLLYNGVYDADIISQHVERNRKKQPTRERQHAFFCAVDKYDGTGFLPVHSGQFQDVYQHVLILSYQRQNQVTFDPETVTSQLMQNVRMTEQL